MCACRDFSLILRLLPAGHGPIAPTGLRLRSTKILPNFFILMKRNILSIFACGMAVALATSACGGKETNDVAKGVTHEKAKGATSLPNYRYVDLDTILSRYVMAQEFNEDMIARQNSMQAEARQHETKLKNQEANIKNKMQNNQYASEAAYKADEQLYIQTQNNAQQKMSALQSEMEQAALKAQETLNDSIQKFIKDYNATRHYDAILYKAATLYIDPALDITDEVVEGLNARYNKVKK